MPKVVFTDEENLAGTSGHMALIVSAGKAAKGAYRPLRPSGLDPEQMRRSDLKAIVSEWLKPIWRTHATEGVHQIAIEVRNTGYVLGASH